MLSVIAQFSVVPATAVIIGVDWHPICMYGIEMMVYHHWPCWPWWLFNLICEFGWFVFYGGYMRLLAPSWWCLIIVEAVLWNGLFPVTRTVCSLASNVSAVSDNGAHHFRSPQCRRILGGWNIVRVRINVVVAAIFDFMTEEDWGE